MQRVHLLRPGAQVTSTEGIALIHRTCRDYARREPVSPAAHRLLMDLAMSRVAYLERRLIEERAARDQAERELDLYAPPPQDERERREVHAEMMGGDV